MTNRKQYPFGEPPEGIELEPIPDWSLNSIGKKINAFIFYNAKNSIVLCLDDGKLFIAINNKGTEPVFDICFISNQESKGL